MGSDFISMFGAISGSYFPFAYVALALIVAFIGRHRRFGFWGYFFGSILLTPIIGVILICASDPKPPRRQDY